MEFIITEPPLAQIRHRFGRGRTYDPQADGKKKLEWDFVSQMREKGYSMISEGPIACEVTFYMPIAKSLSKRKHMELLDSPASSCSKDLDNLCKYILDVMNEIVYKDDRLICKLDAQKIFSSVHRTEIKIYAL